MHSRPPRAHPAPHVAAVDTSSRPRPHPFTGRSGAVRALLLRWRGGTFGQSAGAIVQGKGEWTGHMARERTPKRLVSNKKENSSLYTVVCFGSVQTE